MTVTLSREKHTVTNARRPVRHERSATQRSDTQGQPMPVVAVTGAARGIGRALTVRLAASPDVRKVIAIDSDRGDIAGVTWRVADVRDPALAGRLAGADIVVHADYDLAPGRALAKARCESAGIQVRVPRPGLCTDNGAMVAALGASVVAAGRPPSTLALPADSSLPITEVLVA